MGIPLNRIVAFGGPFISVFAAGIATWLVAKANVLGIGGLDEANVATQVAGALTFLLVAVLSWLGQSRWLTGVQVALRGDAQVAAAALPASPASRPEPQRREPPQPLRPVEWQPPRAAAPQPPQEAAPQPPRAAAAAATGPPPPPPPLDAAAGELAAPTVVDEALPEDAPAADSDDLAAAAQPKGPLAAASSGDPISDGTPDELRPVMPTEVPLQGEPDEHDDKDGES